MKVGDYITVKDGVSDGAMPPDQRDGLIVELLGPAFDQGRRLMNVPPDQALVMFSNGVFLKFHVSQIRAINEINQGGI